MTLVVLAQCEHSFPAARKRTNPGPGVFWTVTQQTVLLRSPRVSATLCFRFGTESCQHEPSQNKQQTNGSQNNIGPEYGAGGWHKPSRVVFGPWRVFAGPGKPLGASRTDVWEIKILSSKWQISVFVNDAARFRPSGTPECLLIY